MSRPPLPGLVRSGAVELAAGALTGWVYTLCITRPEVARRLGIVSHERIKQWHLDLIMMGTATVALGAGVPEAPRAAQIALGVGAWTNANAFLPLAFKPDLPRHPAYQAATAASFVATTAGFCGVALSALRRRSRA